jgi:glycosyltransferase involved in cell wall biosynthesis
MRVAIAYEGAGTWTGIARGLASGLEAHGQEVVLVAADLDRITELVVNQYSRHIHTLTRATRPVMALQNLRVAVRRRRLAPVDVWVQMGSTISLPRATPFVTFEDMTVPLAKRSAYYRGFDEQTTARWSARQARAYARARRCCVASEWAADSLRRDFGVAPSMISVVGLGHSYDPTTPGRKNWEAPTFLWVGRDWERKNGDAVVRAFTQLRAEHRDAVLHLVGSHPSLDVPGVVGHGLLRRTDPAERVELDGLFAAATCFVMPSQNEAFGIVYVEAGATGTPSIGSTRGGAPEAVGPGGICVEPGDDAALTAAMKRICDPATARVLGERARAHSARYTWPNVAERVLAGICAAPAGTAATEFADLAAARAPA